jgi:hypothetical protein
MQRRVPESEGPRDRVQVIAFVTVNEAEPQALAAYLEATGRGPRLCSGLL